jgi:hypothetical protein
VPSSIAWLDTSAEQQRRVQDIIRLFSQQESRDELGIGQIRDVLSNTLFPGTSVLQTRARYFLIVPWAFRYVSARNPGAGVAERARHIERQLVEVLRATGQAGVIGRRTGAAVKNLPSAVFWAGLHRYAILTRDVAPDALTGRIVAETSLDADELAERRVGEWHPTLPAAPAGFPWAVEGGLDLTAAEAAWLRERMVERSRGSVLEHLLLADTAPDESSAPWRDQITLSAPPEVMRLVRHAHAFSLSLHGAALLYNLMVREHYEEVGLNRVTATAADYEQGYAGWLDDVRDHADLLQRWNRGDFWQLIGDTPNNVTLRTRDFVDQWASAVIDGSAQAVLDDRQHRLRRLVVGREKAIKGTQSRLVNDKLLAAWSGASGTGELVYRWPQVRQIVTDIHEGLGRA